MSLRHGDLKWFSNPLQVSMWIADGKKDTFSDGAQSILYIADHKDPNDGIRLPSLAFYAAFERNTL